MSILEDQYVELQHAKHDVIDNLRSNSNNITKSLIKLEEACEKLCFDYERELEHCMDIANEDNI